MTDLAWQPQATLIAAFFQKALGPAAYGVFVHGSAALGGWTSSSDLDMLVTSEVLDQDWLALGRQLLSVLAPAPTVELSVVHAAAAASPESPWPFLLHVDQAKSRVVADGGHGDPDLLMHYLVARDRGLAIIGRPAGAAFGAVPRVQVLRYLQDELTWGLKEADQRYAVLNACRALAYWQDGLVLSKIDGGTWALRHGLEATLVESALAAQVKGCDLGPATLKARSFVEQCRATLGAQRTETKWGL